MTTKEDILEAIKGLSVLDLAELVKSLEETFGVSAAAPIMAALISCSVNNTEEAGAGNSAVFTASRFTRLGLQMLFDDGYVHYLPPMAFSLNS